MTNEGTPWLSIPSRLFLLHCAKSALQLEQKTSHFPDYLKLVYIPSVGLDKRMNTPYVPPEYGLAAFTCPFCGKLTNQVWEDCSSQVFEGGTLHNVEIAVCHECDKASCWIEDHLVYPRASTAPQPHPDLPESCQGVFEEARQVFIDSPRAAAALLRLCLELLLKELLPGNTKKINGMIADLVKQGLPQEVQQAMDVCRVIGNDAVHPGTININDTPQIVENLFKWINFVVQDRITNKCELEDLYASLPTNTLDGIANRDKTS